MVHPNTAPVPTPPPAPSAECNTPVPNLTYMQDLNSSNKATVLSSMTEDNQYYLRDKRDEKPYCVALLKDGNIWMTQNLDHDIKTDGTVIYDSTTTDIPSTWTPSTATYPTSQPLGHQALLLILQELRLGTIQLPLQNPMIQVPYTGAEHLVILHQSPLVIHIITSATTTTGLQL